MLRNKVAVISMFFCVGVALGVGQDCPSALGTVSGSDFQGVVALAQKSLERLSISRRPIVLGPAGVILDLVQQNQTIEGIGLVRSGPDAYTEYKKIAADRRVSGRLKLIPGSIAPFKTETKIQPDLALLPYNLQEILKKRGEIGVTSAIQELLSINPKLFLLIFVTDRNLSGQLPVEIPTHFLHEPKANWFNIAGGGAQVMHSELRNVGFWKSLFDRMGLQVIAEDRISEAVPNEAEPQSPGVGILVHKKGLLF